MDVVRIGGQALTDSTFKVGVIFTKEKIVSLRSDIKSGQCLTVALLRRSGFQSVASSSSLWPISCITKDRKSVRLGGNVKYY